MWRASNAGIAISCLHVQLGLKLIEGVVEAAWIGQLHFHCVKLAVDGVEVLQGGS